MTDPRTPPEMPADGQRLIISEGSHTQSITPIVDGPLPPPIRKRRTKNWWKSRPPHDWRPMAEFDPAKPALVHDKLNDQVIDWLPERHGRDWHQHGHRYFGDGVIEWDGLLLDGWKEPQAPSKS